MTPEELCNKHEACRAYHDAQLTALRERLLTIEMVVWGKDGDNGIRGAIKSLEAKVDALNERTMKLMRFMWVTSAVTPIVVTVLLLLKYLGHL